MMNKKIAMCLCLLLTACAGEMYPANVMLATPSLRSVMPTATATIEPTATIDYLMTAVVAKQTSDEAMRVNVQVTAEQDRRNFEQAGWTVTAVAMELQREAMTQQAAQYTATAYATSIPMTQARQAVLDSTRATEIMMTLSAPTQLAAMAKAKTYAEFSDEIQATDLVFRIVIAVLIIAISMFVFVMAVAKVYSMVKPTAEEARIPELDPQSIPMRPVVGNENITLRAEINCTTDDLFDFADGIINEKMTPAFGMWDGRLKREKLKAIRDAMTEHHLAKLIPKSNGALDILADGEHFLRVVLDTGKPPTPFVCIG
jgi:hypothetical protein